MKPLRIFVTLVLFAGASLTARAMYLDAKAALASVLIHRAWNKTLADGKPHPPWPWADTYPVGRLRIPRLDYDEVVLEGATLRTLAFGPARLFSGASLGEPGNVELAGHRTSWFRPLQGLEARDEIQVQWFDSRKHELRERTYTVDDILIVAPEDVPSLTPPPGDALTLITCYPFGRSLHSPQRFVVLASPAGPSRLPETSRPVAIVERLLQNCGANAPIQWRAWYEFARLARLCDTVLEDGFWRKPPARRQECFSPRTI